MINTIKVCYQFNQYLVNFYPTLKYSVSQSIISQLIKRLIKNSNSRVFVQNIKHIEYKAKF